MKRPKRLRSPIWWFGGKGMMVGKLLKLLPPHDSYKIYVEPFGGGASLLFAKKPSPIEVYNDLDEGLVNFFRVLRDEEKFKKFYHKVVLTPYSRKEFYHCRETWHQCDDEIERAYRWYVVARMSFSGVFGGSWSFAVTSSRHGMAAAVSKWLSSIEMLPEIHQRIMRVQIECNDFRKVIKTYDSEDTAWYIDPPYIPETRRDGKYKHELTLEDHKDLVELLLNVKGKVLLSGYAHPIYELLEKSGWNRIDFKTACHATGKTRLTGILGEGSAKKKQPRIESVWLNY